MVLGDSVIDRHTTLIVWAVLGAVVVAGQLTAVLSKGRLPGLGALVGRVTTYRVGRYLLVLAWMWLGWHAFAR
jgi:Family of unknown function (DUF6186)